MFSGITEYTADSMSFNIIISVSVLVLGTSSIAFCKVVYFLSPIWAIKSSSLSSSSSDFKTIVSVSSPLVTFKSYLVGTSLTIPSSALSFKPTSLPS